MKISVKYLRLLPQKNINSDGMIILRMVEYSALIFGNETENDVNKSIHFKIVIFIIYELMRDERSFTKFVVNKEF